MMRAPPAQKGETALMRLAYRGKEESVKLLIDLKADVNTVDKVHNFPG